MIKPIANRTINGCISVSDLAYQWCEPYIGSLPYEIVHPPIENEKYINQVSFIKDVACIEAENKRTGLVEIKAFVVLDDKKIE